MGVVEAPLDRAAAMRARLRTRVERAGWVTGDVARLDDALAAAFAARRTLAVGDPALLHPGRTALILLDDAELETPDAVIAGALCETLRPELRAPVTDGAAAELVAAVPSRARDGERLLAALLAAAAEVRCIALAERLDHARHWHLRPRPEWAGLAAETEAVYLPVAERTHPTLARRFRWWCRRVGGAG